jgi:hypothetical protein
MIDVIHFKQDKSGYEYIDTEIMLKVKVYTDQEDMYPCISKKLALKRIHKFLDEATRHGDFIENISHEIKINIK